MELPSPESSGIEHVVVVMMENRSFDHFLGWLPTADGKQAGLSYADQNGGLWQTHPLAPDFTGCGHVPPDNLYQSARIQFDAGKMDGFMRAGGDSFSIGYYGEQDLPFLSALARQFTTLDRYFSSFMGPTAPNRMFLHTAQTDRLENTSAVCDLPTIWDSLAKAGVSARCYSEFLTVWGSDYEDIIFEFDDFINDVATGQLPAVSFLDAPYTPETGAFDDHPFADIRNGDAFLSQTYHALANSPYWPNTVLIVTFDEWGGFFDHVAPPRVVVAPNGVDTDLVAGKALLGMRVPTVIVSPFSMGSPLAPRVNSTVFDHTSALKLIQWRWNLPHLTARDASDEIGNLASVLDFSRPRAELPALPVATAVAPSPCDVWGVDPD